MATKRRKWKEKTFVSFHKNESVFFVRERVLENVCDLKENDGRRRRRRGGERDDDDDNDRGRRYERKTTARVTKLGKWESVKCVKRKKTNQEISLSQMFFISCSLECVNKHKAKFSCDGKRDRFQFVNLKEMEDKHVTSDFSVPRGSDGGSRPSKEEWMKSSLNNNKNNNERNKNDNIGQNKNKNNKRKRNGNKHNNNNNTGNIQTATTKVVVGVAAAAI